MKARRATLKLLYDSVNISKDIVPFLRSMTFTDNVDKADDLQITLHDIQGLWKAGWFPNKGATLKATICLTDWNSPGDSAELYCGQFFIDEISAQGPEETVTIKAKSTPVGTAAAPTGGPAQRERKTRAWEASSLKTVAAQIAAENGLTLYFDLPKDIPFERRDQREQSDLAFLQNIAYSEGAWVKISDKKLIVFEKEKNEKTAAVATVAKTIGSAGKGQLSSWNFTSSTAQQYKSCKVSYYDAAKKQTYSYTAAADTLETGQDLVLSERLESQADAERIAKARLHQASVSNVTGSLSMMGDVRMAAGVNIDVEGFGVFDGKFFIDVATHTIDGSGGYKTTVQIHRGEKKE